MAVENDSYCAETDVVAKVQYLSDFTGSTVPTEAQVLIFMASRAALLYAELAQTMGSSAPGPAAFSTSIDSSTDIGAALNNALIHYNAVGAALDVFQAAGATTEPSRTERVTELFAQWEEHKEKLEMLARLYLGLTTRTATHESVGEITAATVVSRTEDGLVITGATEF